MRKCTLSSITPPLLLSLGGQTMGRFQGPPLVLRGPRPQGALGPGPVPRWGCHDVLHVSSPPGSCGPITSWQIDEVKMETVTEFIFLGSKVIADGDCSHTIIIIFIIFIFFISWRLITLLYCSGFCHTLTWISHGYCIHEIKDTCSLKEKLWHT